MRFFFPSCSRFSQQERLQWTSCTDFLMSTCCGSIPSTKRSLTLQFVISGVVLKTTFCLYRLTDPFLSLLWLSLSVSSCSVRYIFCVIARSFSTFDTYIYMPLSQAYIWTTLGQHVGFHAVDIYDNGTFNRGSIWRHHPRLINAS